MTDQPEADASKNDETPGRESSLRSGLLKYTAGLVLSIVLTLASFWVAGTGTDASPYYRVFNPVTQGKKFDPDGTYVQRWVPELRHLEGRTAHEPWERKDGYEHDYPQRIVDHDQPGADAERHDDSRGGCPPFATGTVKPQPDRRGGGQDGERCHRAQ